jgi:hypothetical protein
MPKFNSRKMTVSLFNLSYGKEYKLDLSEAQTKLITEKYGKNFDLMAKDIRLDNEKIFLKVFGSFGIYLAGTRRKVQELSCNSKYI